jgi:hypothetical protein
VNDPLALSALSPLPPPLAIGSGSAGAPAGSAAPRDFDCCGIAVHIWDAGIAIDVEKTLAFAEVLAASRHRRGALADLTVLVPAGSERPTAGSGWIAVPHVFVWEPTCTAALAWELLEDTHATQLMGAPIGRMRFWAERSERLIGLARLAPLSGQQSSSQHLSFRWILAHEEAAAQVLSGYSAAVDHVSLHVSVEEQALVVDVLTNVVGLLAVDRPASIATPGCWLQCGTVRLHLNSRETRGSESSFPGTAPNHLCFRVRSVEEIEQDLAERGISTARAGSLRHQLWWQLSGGTTFEFQQQDSIPDTKIYRDDN